MEIIDELEPHRRGPYAGAVGYVDFAGNMDTCIALRTIVVHDDKAYVQAGAGIVADSVPANEWNETLNKARGLLKAIEIAESWRGVSFVSDTDAILQARSCRRHAGVGHLRNLRRQSEDAGVQSLAGTWAFRLDPTGKGVAAGWFREALPQQMNLPGSTDEAGFGTSFRRGSTSAGLR